MRIYVAHQLFSQRSAQPGTQETVDYFDDYNEGYGIQIIWDEFSIDPFGLGHAQSRYEP